MNMHTHRRKRRRANARIRYGQSAMRAHRRVGGRTGSVNGKRTPGSAPHHYRSMRPNPPGPTIYDIDRKRHAQVR